MSGDFLIREYRPARALSLVPFTLSSYYDCSYFVLYNISSQNWKGNVVLLLWKNGELGAGPKTLVLMLQQQVQRNVRMRVMGFFLTAGVATP